LLGGGGRGRAVDESDELQLMKRSPPTDGGNRPCNRHR